MTGEEYKNKASRFNDGKSLDRLKSVTNSDFIINYGEIIQGCLGLTGEAGEVADMIKKHIFHEKELDMMHFKKELGDVMWYIALISNSCGFNIDEIMDINIEKLSARYPNGFNSYDANNRKEGDV